MKHQANILLEAQLTQLGIEFEREFRFDKVRRWRADYLLKGILLHGMEILIEIEGQVYQAGRHTRGQGYEQDCTKYNHAALGGYIVLRFSTGQVLKGIAAKFIRDYLINRGAE